MDPSDLTLSTDLTREDDVGMIVKGHIHIEYQLQQLACRVLPFPERCDWNKIGYRQTVELALACGLPDDMRGTLNALGSLRNTFAHRLDAALEKQRVMDLYNGLSDRLREGLKVAYAATGAKAEFRPVALSGKDLLILIFLSARQAIKAGILALDDPSDFPE